MITSPSVSRLTTRVLKVPESPDYREALRETLHATNDSARLFRTVSLSCVVIAFYILAIALGADDRLLFVNGDLVAPIVNVAMKASSFFTVAPVVLLLVHCNLMMQAIFLARKIADYRRAVAAAPTSDDGERKRRLRLLFPIPATQLAEPESHAPGAWLLRLYLVAMLAILPMVTLGIVQIQFLDFQDPAITWLHTGVLLADLVLTMCTLPAIRSIAARETVNNDSGDPSIHSVRQRLRQYLDPLWCSRRTLAVPVFATAGVLSVSHCFSSPVRLSDDTDGILAYVEYGLNTAHGLNVLGQRLYPGSDARPPDDACEDRAVGLNLVGRSYRGAILARAVLCNALLVDVDFSGAAFGGVALQGADLRGAQLQGKNLVGVQLQGAVLQGAELQFATLSERASWLPQGIVADLRRADLRWAQLLGARLQGVPLDSADLGLAGFQEAYLVDARLRGAILRDTHFQGANLRNVELQGMDLSSGRFHEATLTNVRLQGANLTFASLPGANLALAHLQGADLTYADLRGANLASARLDGADLTNARLEGAYLRGAQLQGANLTGARLLGVASTLPRPNTPVSDDFVATIRGRANTETDLTGIAVPGGLATEEMDSVVAAMMASGVPSDRIGAFVGRIAALRPNGNPQSLEATGFVAGQYDDDDATLWIADFVRGYCSEVPALYRRIEERGTWYSIANDSIQRWAPGLRCPEPSRQPILGPR